MISQFPNRKLLLIVFTCFTALSEGFIRLVPRERNNDQDPPSPYLRIEGRQNFFLITTTKYLFIAGLVFILTLFLSLFN